MARYERIKPLDILLSDIMTDFGSGRDRQRNRDLDEMIWELGDYENEEPPMEMPEVPIEEELVEKKISAHTKIPFKNVKKPRRRRTAAGAAR